MTHENQQLSAPKPHLAGVKEIPPPRHSVRKVIRVRKEDSAFVYFILESYEGITAYSTMPSAPGDPHRDLELLIPPDFVGETQTLLGQLGDLIYELES